VVCNPTFVLFGVGSSRSVVLTSLRRSGELELDLRPMVRSGRRVAGVAGVIRVSEESLRNRVKQDSLDRGGGDEERGALRKENVRLKEERDLLKRAVMPGSAGRPAPAKGLETINFPRQP
jgi:hypothetical protein